MGTQVDRRTLGRTGIRVTSLCIGTSPLGRGAAPGGGEDVSERAVETVLAAFRSPIAFLDTSNGYGDDGSSEKRIGDAIRRNGGLPPGFVLQTKVDADPVTGDYSGARVRESLAESLDRLGLDHLQLLALHDPEFMTQDGFAPGGALEAMVALRDEGVVDHLAVAAGDIAVTRRYLATGEFDVVLNHSRYTLLDRSAHELFAEARADGLGVLNAAPYGGGMLSKGPQLHGTYAYRERETIVAERALAMQRACKRHGVPLAAAALQFSVRSPLVDSTVVGLSSPERIGQALDLMAVDVPDELWTELETLVPPRSGWLG